MDKGSNQNENSSKIFSKLFEKYYGFLCYHAVGLTKDEEEAKDIVSQIFTYVWKHQLHLIEKMNIVSYLKTAVTNASLNYLKKQNVRLKNFNGLQHFFNQDVNAFRNEQIKNEMLESIYAEVQGLSYQCRKIFKLMYIDGLSIEEVADKLQLAKQTVRNHHTIAIKQLRKKIFSKEVFVSSTGVLAASTLLSLTMTILTCLIFNHLPGM